MKELIIEWHGTNDYDIVGEVVRCKDCKWWSKENDSLQGRCALLQIYPTGEWYCANAERKEE